MRWNGQGQLLEGGKVSVRSWTGFPEVPKRESASNRNPAEAGPCSGGRVASSKDCYLEEIIQFRIKAETEP